MDNKVYTKPDIRKKGISVLVKELGVKGFIEFMQDFGLNYGDYTKEKEKWLYETSVEEVINKLKN